MRQLNASIVREAGRLTISKHIAGKEEGDEHGKAVGHIQRRLGVSKVVQKPPQVDEGRAQLPHEEASACKQML